MTFNEYQKRAYATDLMGKPKNISAIEPSFMYKILGLAGESGEVAEKFKKLIRDKDGVISEIDKIELTKELGDVLWYVAVIAEYLDVKFDFVASQNLEKVNSRKSRKKINGSGDNR